MALVFAIKHLYNVFLKIYFILYYDDDDELMLNVLRCHLTY